MPAPKTAAPWRAGDKFTLELGDFSRPAVHQYVSLMRDTNPIHGDYAEVKIYCAERNIRIWAPEGEWIVPGAMVVGMVAGRLVDKFGPLSSPVHIEDLPFKRPTFTGVPVDGKAEILAIEEAGPDWQLKCRMELLAKARHRNYSLLVMTYSFRTPKPDATGISAAAEELLGADEGSGFPQA
jgi:acyl dehydratase